MYWVQGLNIEMHFEKCHIISFEISNQNNIIKLRDTWNMVHVFCNGIAFWCVAFEWWLHIYATKISLFACLILRYTCMFFQDPATTIRLYMYETMIWSQNKVVSWCVNFFGTHHLSYCSCVILHHIYPIIVYTLILSVVMGRGGGWQARGAVFYEKKLKQINSHIQSNLDIQDYFNGMTRNGVKKIISKIQNNPNIGDKKLESSIRNNLQC